VHNPAYLLRGILKRGLCGRALTAGSNRKNGREYRYYRCVSYSKGGKDACRATSIPAGPIEDFVVEKIREIARRGGLADDLFRKPDQAHAHVPPGSFAGPLATACWGAAFACHEGSGSNLTAIQLCEHLFDPGSFCGRQVVQGLCRGQLLVDEGQGLVRDPFDHAQHRRASHFEAIVLLEPLGRALEGFVRPEVRHCSLQGRRFHFVADAQALLDGAKHRAVGAVPQHGRRHRQRPQNRVDFNHTQGLLAKAPGRTFLDSPFGFRSDRGLQRFATHLAAEVQDQGVKLPHLPPRLLDLPPDDGE
jgi:hypothetical protein